MTLQQLHYAIVISETGSMNKAAERLYIAQPSLTGAMQELERELGITIFHRSGRGVTLTNDGQEFIDYARQVYHQYETLAEKYAHPNELKKKFGVTTQHYSFAVKAFVEMAKSFDTAKYDFAIRESKTREVIDDVASLRSEIGILYLSDFNRNVITKILRANDIEFHELMDCKSYVFLWKNHPLADRTEIHGEELSDYPFLSFEQGGNDSFYFSEELSCHERLLPDRQGQRPRHDGQPDGRALRLHALLGHRVRGAQRRGLPRHSPFGRQPHQRRDEGRLYREEKPDPQQRRQAVYRENTGISSRGTGRFI